MDVAEYRKFIRWQAFALFCVSALGVVFGMFMFGERNVAVLVAGTLGIESGLFMLALPIGPDDPVRIDYESPRIPWLIASQALVVVVGVVCAFVWSPWFALVAVSGFAAIVSLKLKLNPKAARDPV